MDSIYLVIVIILLALASLDLVVGVSNDAVNFLNSSIGSKVAPVGYFPDGLDWRAGRYPVFKRDDGVPEAGCFTQISSPFPPS